MIDFVFKSWAVLACAALLTTQAILYAAQGKPIPGVIMFLYAMANTLIALQAWRQ